MKRSGSRFLARPAVEVLRDGQAVHGAIVRLQDRKASHGLQPDPERLVLVLLDRAGLPVSVHYLERREPLAVLRDLLDVVVRAPATSPSVHRRFASPVYLGRLHGALRRASSLLPEHPSFAVAGS